MKHCHDHNCDGSKLKCRIVNKNLLCGCKHGWVRDNDGECIKKSECPKEDSTDSPCPEPEEITENVEEIQPTD